VASKSSQLFAGISVPNFDGGIIGPSHQNVVLELKAHDTVSVTLEHFDRATLVLPVHTNDEAVAVDILPWTVTSLEITFVFFEGLSRGCTVTFGQCGTLVIAFNLALSADRNLHCGAGLVDRILGGWPSRLVVSPIGGTELDLTLCLTQALTIQKRKTPATLVTLAANMLFTHPMPDHIVIGQSSPAMRHLGCSAEGRSVEVAEDFERQLWGEGGKEIDANEFADAGRDVGELWEAALGQYSLEHESALLGWSSREQGPHMGDSLLITLRKGIQIAL
jgi:hypothetical protein